MTADRGPAFLTDTNIGAHVDAVLRKEWLASTYLDNDQWGVITEDNEIVVGLSSRLTELLARHIADVHNAAMTADRGPDASCAGRDADLEALSELTWYEEGPGGAQIILPCWQRDEAIRLCREARDKSDFYRNACASQAHEIEQILAQALGGYPWYCHDQANFPNTTEADGVCVGDETAESLAVGAARRIRELTAERDRRYVEGAEQYDREVVESVERRKP